MTRSKRLLISSVSALLLLPGCGGSSGTSSPPTPPPTPPPAPGQIMIQPMTSVAPSTGASYFSDPYPIQTTAPSSASTVPTFAGTTKELLNCPGNLQPNCFMATPNTVAPGALAQQATAVGSSINGFENLNVYQDSSGAWQMATTAFVTNPADPSRWNIIVHAHPSSVSSGIPTAWVADTILVGSLTQPAPADYDGKYFEDSGNLYLVYSARLSTQPSEDGIVAQSMQSAMQPAASAPVPLLGPENANGGYNSELFNGLNQPNTFKLMETGNITKVQGKYAMAYSTGAYDQPDYKAGIAWSDTFLPPSGSYYRRVQKTDVTGVWGQPNHAEVQYLLQAQESAWPNYVASQVLSPGVPSIVTDSSGKYYLFFAGYAPSDAPILSTGLYDGSHRRPFYINLQVDIPAGAAVATTPAQDLTSWIEPATTP